MDGQENKLKKGKVGMEYNSLLHRSAQAKAARMIMPVMMINVASIATHHQSII